MLIEGQSFVSCNEATVKLFGLKDISEIKYKHPSEVSPELQPDGTNFMKSASDRIKEALKNGYAKFEWVHRRTNGEEFPAEVWLTTILFQGRKIVHAVVRDLSEKKKAQQELIVSENKLNNIISNANTGIFVSQAGRFKFANSYAANMIGLPLEELIDQSFIKYTFRQDIPTLAKLFSKIIEDKEASEKFVYRYHTHLKEIKWAEINIIYHIWEEKPAVLCFINDIT